MDESRFAFQRAKSEYWTFLVLLGEVIEHPVGVTPRCSFLCRSAIGKENGFKPQEKDVSGLPKIFPINPSRRISYSGRNTPRDDLRGPKKANESDVSLLIRW